MAALVDISAKRFGHWVVLGRAPSRYGQTFWYCRCDCGREDAVEASNLKNQSSQSCGCLGRRTSPKERHRNTNRPWTEAELEALRIGYPINGVRCLKWTEDNAGILPRSPAAIKAKAKRLGLSVGRRIIGRKDVWSEREINIVITHYPHGGLAACVPHLKRSAGAIKLKASTLGIVSKDHFWTDEEDALLRRTFRREGAKGCLSRLPSRSYDAIRDRAKRLGVKRIRHDLWKKEEVQILRSVYPTGGSLACHEEMPHRTREAILDKVRKLGIKSRRNLTTT